MSDFYKPTKKTPPPGPVLKRNEHNELDRGDAARVTGELVHKLLTEERAFKKEITYNARGTKRDIVVMMTIMVRNSVDGKIVADDLGYDTMDERDPYKYKVFDYVEAPIMARDIPMSRSMTGKQLMNCFKVLVNYLARMGVVDRI